MKLTNVRGECDKIDKGVDLLICWITKITLIYTYFHTITLILFFHKKYPNKHPYCTRILCLISYNHPSFIFSQTISKNHPYFIFWKNFHRLWYGFVRISNRSNRKLVLELGWTRMSSVLMSNKPSFPLSCSSSSKIKSYGCLFRVKGWGLSALVIKV